MCFAGFKINILQDFCVIAVRREKRKLVPLNQIPTGRSTPLANASRNIDDVSTFFVIVLNRFIIFASYTRTSTSVNFFKQYARGSCGGVEFRSG